MIGAGTRLGPYEVLFRLGAGGMGEVWKARDARLSREVAIKVLPEALSADRERLARFEQEARSASALNHPNIVTVYDVGRTGDISYIAMELVEGKTLREMLSAGALPVRRTLSLAAQVADGLAKAHGAGIVHRDLKPENLIVSTDGFMKILDFGLAKLVPDSPEALSDMLTAAGPQTQSGVVMGTVGYMSPEQASGKAVDLRSDQFSFGSILYEMVTGKRAFSAATHAETLAAIIREEPESVAVVNPAAPVLLRWIVERCLAKDPEERYASSRDLARDLASVRDHVSEAGSLPVALTTPSGLSRRRSRERIAWSLVTAVLLAATLALAALYFRKAPTEARPMRFSLFPPEKTAFSGTPSISPDGRTLVLVVTSADARTSLWVRPLESVTARLMPGTEDASFPFWSPESAAVGFFAGRKLKKVPISGGPAAALCDAPQGRGGTWSRNGFIVFAPDARGGLYSIPATGGTPRPLTALDSSRQETSHRWPEFLPDGGYFLYLAWSSRPERRGVFVGSLESKSHALVMGGESLAAYAPPGYLLFQRQETVLAQAFQAKSLALAGEPAIVAEHVFVPSIDGSAAFSVSRNGTLAFRSGGRESTQLVWFDRNGKQISSVNAAGSYRDPALSPDGRRIAVNQLDPELNTWELWLLDLTRGAASRLTFDPGNDYLPVWSPDGTRIVFASDRGASGLYQLYTKLASGAGSEELLLESSSSKSPMDWSSDGRFIVYEEYGPKTRRDLWVLPLSGNRKPVPFLQTAADEFQGQFSPDGRWIAYGSDESGAFEIYVQPFPAIGGKWQISTGGGTQPRWRRDGKGLFYLADSRIMAVEVKTASSTFEAGIPRPLFPVRLGCCIGMGTDEFVPAADGQRFLVVNRLDHGESQPLTVVLNWMSELRTK